MQAQIISWLEEQSLNGAAGDTVLDGLCERLLDSALELDRAVLGCLVHHPQFDGVNFIWERGATHVTRELVRRQEILQQPSPFLQMQTIGLQELRHKLENKGVLPFPLFERLQRLKFTDYVSFFKPFGTAIDRELWHELPDGVTLHEGVYGSFATKRPGGFAEGEIEQLRRLVSPLAVAIKVGATLRMAETLLGAYLGAASGQRVLRGQVRRGQGRIIDALVWYNDMRASTRLAKAEPLDTYLSTLNSYHECMTEAVIGHGGEVLKFVGDGLLAIFPFDGDEEARTQKCLRAISAARASLSGIRLINAGRRDRGLSPIGVGIALHAGEVMYGNVGSERRLDFTVTGPPVNEAVRLEKLCKKLRVPLVFSEVIARALSASSTHLGRHHLRGIRSATPVYTLSDLTLAEGSNACPTKPTSRMAFKPLMRISPSFVSA